MCESLLLQIFLSPGSTDAAVLHVAVTSSPVSADPAVLAVTSPKEGKRQSYIHELINTEETYMEDMSVVMDVSPPKGCFVCLHLFLLVLVCSTARSAKSNCSHSDRPRSRSQSHHTCSIHFNKSIS